MPPAQEAGSCSGFSNSLSPVAGKIGEDFGGCCWPGARGQPVSGPLFLVTSSREAFLTSIQSAPLALCA